MLYSTLCRLFVFKVVRKIRVRSKLFFNDSFSFVLIVVSQLPSRSGTLAVLSLLVQFSFSQSTTNILHKFFQNFVKLQNTKDSVQDSSQLSRFREKKTHIYKTKNSRKLSCVDLDNGFFFAIEVSFISMKPYLSEILS